MYMKIFRNLKKIKDFYDFHCQIQESSSLIHQSYLMQKSLIQENHSQSNENLIANVSHLSLATSPLTELLPECTEDLSSGP